MRVGSGARSRRQRYLVWATVLGVLATLLPSLSTVTADEGPAICGPRWPDPTPIFISDECEDPDFKEGYAFVEVDEIRQVPVPHRVVIGGYKGTPLRFAFYFPEAEQYQERFVQGPTHQLRLTAEVASQREIEHAFAMGAYLVETNNGGHWAALTARDAMEERRDPAIMGYRAAAAAARFSEVMAQEIYGYEHDPVGLVYGGSGGAYQTICAAENTTGVWDGYVPFVMGHPDAAPDHYMVRINALRVLRERDMFPKIMDAIEPGGIADPNRALTDEQAAAIGLTPDEQQAYNEATLLGFPPRGWFNHATMTGGALGLVAAYVPLMDPTYAEDFWTHQGYLGTEQSTAGTSVRAARIREGATVLAVSPAITPPPYEATGPAYPQYMLSQYITGPLRTVTLTNVPEGDLTGAHLEVQSGKAEGRSFALANPLFADTAAVNDGLRSANTVTFAGGEDWHAINLIEPGDQVAIDNSWYLSMQTYHRHQRVDEDQYGWDQFRKPNGDWMYPVRKTEDFDGDGEPDDLLVGRRSSRNGGGCISNGRFNATPSGERTDEKVIVAQSLMDQDAYAWGADWYRTQVIKDVGEDDLDDDFRLWMTDHALHGGGGGDARTVSYRGVLDQALLDVWHWIEDGTPPPSSSAYTVQDTQIVPRPTAAERGGIQPVVDLTVNGGERADIAVGDTVTFTATVTVPPGTGDIRSSEWSFLGDGAFEEAEPQSGETVTVTATYTYDEPGTYFPALQVTSQRDEVAGTPYGQIQNLGRVRVVVS